MGGTVPSIFGGVEVGAETKMAKMPFSVLIGALLVSFRLSVFREREMQPRKCHGREWREGGYISHMHANISNITGRHDHTLARLFSRFSPLGHSFLLPLNPPRYP